MVDIEAGNYRYQKQGAAEKRHQANDLLSLLMFQPDYLKRLIELGWEDAEACKEEIDAFLRHETAVPLE